MLSACPGGDPWIPGLGEEFMEWEVDCGSSMDWEEASVEAAEDLKLEDFMGKSNL